MGTPNLSEIMDTLINSATPYSGESAFDPDTDLGVNQTRYNTYDGHVSALAPITDYGIFVTTSVNSIPNLPLVDLIDVDLSTDSFNDVVSAAVEASNLAAYNTLRDQFEARLTNRQQRAIARFTAGMADVNAVMSSAFTIGLGLLEAETIDQLNEFDAKIEYDVIRDLVQTGFSKTYDGALARLNARYESVARGVPLIAQLQQFDVQANSESTRMQTELNRIKIVSKVEQFDRDIELDVLDALWDISVFQHGANFLSSISGAPLIPKGPSKTQSVLGGALGGAAVGAAFGPVGVGIGALVGGLGGFL
jgi:hypothetical protein